MKKLYEFKLENYDGKTTLRNYHDEDRNGKCTTPTTEQDKKIVKDLTTLLEESNLNELNVKIEIN